MKKKLIVSALAAGLCLAVATTGVVIIDGGTGGTKSAVAANVMANSPLPSIVPLGQSDPAVTAGSTKVIAVSKIYAEDFLKTERQFAGADIVVAGTIVKVDAARWNSPDGAEWKPDESVALPIPYTTFYIQPTQIVKGTPKWDTPIPFRVEGGAFGPDAANAAEFGTVLPEIQLGNPNPEAKRRAPPPALAECWLNLANANSAKRKVLS